MFHSTTMAPGAIIQINESKEGSILKFCTVPGPWVANKMSVISTIPSEPGSPTRTITVGLVWSENAAPPPMMTLHASPTICVPAGMVRVPVMKYVPASKKIILHPENCTRYHKIKYKTISMNGHTWSNTACSAAVSSVFPSPLAPWSLTLTN